MSMLSKAPDIITTKWCEEAVKEIEAIKWDDEAAHSMEDDLHMTVLRAIANGCIINAERCAEIVIKTEEIEFARWCA